MLKGLTWALLIALLAAGTVYEARTSQLQAAFFSQYAASLTYEMAPGPTNAILYPTDGPYNQRLGYTRLSRLFHQLPYQGYEISQQARFSMPLLRHVDWGGNPPYKGKSQAGLSLLDRSGEVIHASRHPTRTFQSFDEIPSLVVDTLLFIENRELLDDTYPMRNPAVEWRRLGKAISAHLREMFEPGQDTAGASTLATQLEKYRYSPAGLTSNAGEKLSQMLSATVRAYQDGPDTSRVRRQIVRDYLNSTPLAARAGFGEVHGIGEGLWAWFDLDAREVSALLHQYPTELSLEQARAYKAVLSLILSQRRPSHFLLAGREELARLTDSYLRVLTHAGVIDARLRDMALSQPLSFREGAPPISTPAFTVQKAVNSSRTELLSLLRLNSLYELERMDLSVRTTIASDVQRRVEETLSQVVNPEQARAMGLLGERLLHAEQLDAVRFSVVLYETTPTGNKLRVKADNLNQPFDLNDGSKLDLGSTAKLRTLITYLEVVQSLYQRYRDIASQADSLPANLSNDPLRQWAITLLRERPDITLEEMLRAAMRREYSANPNEVFFTAGGQHRFGNFERNDNSRVMSVNEAFNRSVNLVFVRMMRDITRYYINETPESDELLQDPGNPLRQDYLHRFADKEGREYLQRFYNTYRGMSQEQILATLARRTRAVPYRLATAFRAVMPEAGLEEMTAFMHARLGEELPAPEELATLYQRYGRDRYNSNDRAYLAGVHPLELWLVEQLLGKPNTSYATLVRDGAEARQEAYAWLFNTRNSNRQQQRIRMLVEEDAYLAIHQQWQRLGYPFPSLVPSYATSLGVSADRPSALAELMGIIVNDGLRIPTTQIESLHFAEGTPYETLLVETPKVGEQVLSPEISRVVRQALMDIVETGTGRRLSGVFKRNDGEVMAVGGKTGTGDHRSRRLGRGGVVLEETVVNRNAIFTFFIDDRFYGTILASVGGPQAAEFEFTSGLAAQLLKSLEPALQPLLQQRDTVL